MALNYTTLATTALGFTVALAWNNAVSKSVASVFPGYHEKAAAHAMVVYALVTTMLVIFVVAAINHTRKIVHRYSGRGGSPAPAPPLLTLASTTLQPIVRLWDPSRG